MDWTLVHLVEVALFAAVAVPVRLLFVAIRRSLLAGLDGPRRGLRPVATAADVVTGLVYLSYALGVVPFEFVPRVEPAHYDMAFDAVALFVLLVATAEVTSLLTINRAAHHLEQWPPKPA